MQKNQTRFFSGIFVPREIWLSPSLSPIEKIIVAEVYSLNNRNEGYTDSVETLSDFVGLSHAMGKSVVEGLKNRGVLVFSNTTEVPSIKVNLTHLTEDEA